MELRHTNLCEVYYTYIFKYLRINWIIIYYLYYYMFFKIVFKYTSDLSLNMLGTVIKRLKNGNGKSRLVLLRTDM